MGTLKPGAKYIYERQDGVIYAREFGEAPDKRIAIGWDWKVDNNPDRVRGSNREQILENQLWHDIREAGKTNPALQKVLDQCIMLYHLTREENAEHKG